MILFSGSRQLYIKPLVKLLLACVLFIVSIASRIPLLDTNYAYSFEPDSEFCVEITRSFYFFFKHPVKENYPHTLESVPTYLDGDFIISALTANVVAPLCKAGIIKTPLRDSDNSLVIFSMRWTGVLLDALSVILAFAILLLLTDNTILSFGICLFYYLLNIQTLNIDLSRVDHFVLFSAMLVMLTALLLFYFPRQKKYYVFCGIAIGLASATKANFPFHLLIIAIILAFLVYKKRLAWPNVALFALAFFATFLFVFQRWLMYPENIIPTIRDIFHTGEDWFSFWGNGNYSYYLTTQFYNHGSSSGITLFLVLFYASFIYCAVLALKQKDALKGILCLTFILQSIALVVSPKVGRYAIMVPLWASVFIVISLSGLILLFRNKTFPSIISILLLLPVFLYSWADYSHKVTLAQQREISILKTRVEPYHWMQQNIKPASVIAIQAPRVSNPPIFDLPNIYTTSFFEFPFLYRDSLSKFRPDLEGLKKSVNYIILSDKEMAYHIYTMQQQHCDSSLIESWLQFYALMRYRFRFKCFSSNYDNYGVKSICIYRVNDSTLNNNNTDIEAQSSLLGENPLFSWSLHPIKGTWGSAFQIQISDDSLMQWLVYGSRDGFYSKFRAANNPVKSDKEVAYIPLKISTALDEGLFNQSLNVANTKALKGDINTFFGNVLLAMEDSARTFRESLKLNFGRDNADFYKIIDSLYKPDGDILNARFEDYLKLTHLKITRDEINNTAVASHWKFIPPVKLEKGKRYFWRVRVNNHTAVLTNWSKIQSFQL